MVKFIRGDKNVTTSAQIQLVIITKDGIGRTHTIKRALVFHREGAGFRPQEECEKVFQEMLKELRQERNKSLLYTEGLR